MSLPPRVLPITPDACAAKGLSSFVRVLEDVHAAGAEGLLLREPSLNDRDMLELAIAARGIFHDGWLGVHDRVHIGKVVCADGVHLGFRSLLPAEARLSLGPGVAVGVSHHLDELRDSAMLADYRFLSPVFPTSSKPSAVATLGLSGLSTASMLSRTWALGGVDVEHARAALDCGAAGVAAIGGVFTDGRAGQNMEALLRAAEL